MANPKLRLGFREPEIDTNRPFVDGTVQVEGFDIETSNYRGWEHIDAWDASLGGLMQTKGKGDHPFVSIPAFPNRKFRLSYIFVNGRAGIESPKDLEGKRVYVSGTAGIWARGALLNHYGVDFTKVHWVMGGASAKSWGPGIEVESLTGITGPLDVKLDTMLVEGDLDAVIEPNVLPSISRRDPRVHRLFPDYRTEEKDYWKRTGIFPISHVVSLTQEFVDHHPEAPVALLEAYRHARDVAFDRLYGTDPEILVVSWVASFIDDQRALMGDDYWAYNIQNNARALEAMMLFAHQMGVTPTQLDYLSFFDQEAAALPGS